MIARAIIAALLLAGATLAAAAVRADDGLRRLTLEAGQPEPLMRIGLAAEHRVLVSAEQGIRIVDPASGTDVWQAVYEGEVAVLADGGPTGEVATVFRIQVGAFTAEQAATRERERLARLFGAEAIVRYDADRGVWRVRLGKADDRLALQPLMERLRAAGFDDFWISEEPANAAAGVRLRVVDAEYDSRVLDVERIAVLPAGRAKVRVGGTAYRGLIELRISPYGTVRPVNWVGLEPYLRGVVPRELGPAVWPRIEALKAQSVAARTYAWRHRGQFSEQGFDLCATPRCQVYGGADAEHPLSDRAVSATRGEVLTWKRQPINAYYTATCGGHTENAENVFPEEGAAPYLRGVPCRAEGAALASQGGTLRGRSVEPLEDPTGRDVTPEWVLLRAAGVVDDEDRKTAAVTSELVRKWTRRLTALAGRPAPAEPPGGCETLARALATIARDTGWIDRAHVLLDEADVPALLRGSADEALDGDERRVLAYLVWMDGLSPFPDGSYRAGEAADVARLLPPLARIAEAYDALDLQRAMVSRVRDRRLTLVRNAAEIRLELEREPWLLGWTAERTIPVDELALWPGDRVRYRIAPTGRIDYLELVPPVKGTSDDRSAAVYAWEVRKTRRELERTINRRVAVGEVRDLQVGRRGVSGRITEMTIVGSKATTTVRGFDVRRLLDLRESLTVIEPQRDAAGRIEAVVFAGKGWGHGVGLCQVGAYGMAVRGASYREILAHYYRGTELRRAARGR